MRISIDENDPGYVTYRAMERIGVEGSLEVYLDGRKLKGCVTADEDTGEVEIIAWKPGQQASEMRDENGRLRTDMRRGKVKIRFERRTIVKGAKR